MFERFKHLREISKWWWILIGVIWSSFWIADECIAKWASVKLKA
jgi:hypothetical protein